MMYRVIVPVLQVAGPDGDSNCFEGSVLQDDQIDAADAARYVAHGLLAEVPDPDPQPQSDDAAGKAD